MIDQKRPHACDTCDSCDFDTYKVDIQTHAMIGN